MPEDVAAYSCTCGVFHPRSVDYKVERSQLCVFKLESSHLDCSHLKACLGLENLFSIWCTLKVFGTKPKSVTMCTA